MSVHTLAQAEAQVGPIPVQCHVLRNLQLLDHTEEQTGTLLPCLCGFLTSSQVVQRDSKTNSN